MCIPLIFFVYKSACKFIYIKIYDRIYDRCLMSVQMCIYEGILRLPDRRGCDGGFYDG
ncbi:hypothetical protein HanRHA438_Chr16g0767541 [Helianthus annuus]|nr:hypothetical protein HanRHA438_Chr16g0767541 [Helianthus annuus]